jgi:riboflavin synthase
MFTGLVSEVRRLHSTGRRGSLMLLDLDAPRTAPTLKIGDSLAVNGICLTVTGVNGDRVQVEAAEETRRVTTIEHWRPGARLHLEPSLRVGDPLGGHFVLGHVDGIGRVASFTRRVGGAAVMRVSLAPSLAIGLLPKGSIAVDGVSLTLDEGPFSDSFAITLVPHTLSATRFGEVAAGELVNLELDILAKAARSQEAAARGGSVTLSSILGRGWQRGAD